MRTRAGYDPLTCWSSRLWRKLRSAGLAGAVLLNGGCGVTGPIQWVKNGFKVGPNYCKPPAPLAQEWIEAKDPRTQGPPRHGEWWTVFQDPILNHLICRAYQQNPNLRAVGTRVLQARAQQAIAVGNILPQLQQITGLYPQGTIPPTSLGPQQIASQSSAHMNFTGFNLAWELDFWGKYRRQVESANASLDASVENYDDALVTLFADMATNYVQYRIAQLRIKIARDNLETQEKLVKRAEEQREKGTAIRLDVDQLRTLMEQTRSTIPALQIAQGQANDQLCILVGEPPHDLEHELGPGPELGNLPLPATPASVCGGIPADLLLRRPDVRSAERQVAAQSPQTGVATANLYPSISIATTLSDLNLGAGPLASSGFLGFFSPQFTWNILNYGRLVNNVHLQEAKTQELIATFQNKVLTAAQEVQTALRSFLRSQEQAEALARSTTAAENAARIGEQLFSEVKADVNRLFILENSKLQEQDNLAVARGNIALYLISVYRALGGGWEIRYRPDACCPPGTSGSPPPVSPTAVPEQLPQPALVPPPPSAPRALDDRTGEQKP